jgi:tetratricopeptide (TPR) repeat protein
MRSLYLLLILAFLPFWAMAQQGQYSTTNKNAIEHYLEANKNIDDHLYDEAIIQLQSAVDSDKKFIEAHAQLADVLRLRHQNKPAIEHYLAVLVLDANYNRAVYLKLGDLEITDAQYTNAQKHLEKYLTYPNITPQNTAYAQKLIADCKFSTQALLHPVAFKPVNMGAAGLVC